MKKLRLFTGLLAVSVLAGAVMAETAATSGKMLRMQPGSAVYTILDPSGVRPMPGAEVAIRDMQDGEALTTAVADKAGRAVVELTEGRFILSVDALNLSLLDVAADAEHTECRIVMPSKDMLVGGQAGDDEGEDGDDAAGAAGDGGGAAVTGTTVGMGSTLMTPVVIGGGLVLVGGAVYAIDESSSDSSRSEEVVSGEAETVVVRRSTRTEYVPVPVPPTPGY